MHYESTMHFKKCLGNIFYEAIRPIYQSGYFKKTMIYYSGKRSTT